MMQFFFQQPVNIISACGLLTVAVFFAVRGIVNLRCGLTQTDNPSQTIHVVRGIRGIIITTSVIFIAAGISFSTKWPIYFGLAFLAEELVETTIMVLALRSGQASRADAP
ncbi:MAG: hypothetical protein OEV49_03785 [candidate division Zixibacteria bacterium]|nr:hypothetical protein [candidate division Zixibacteria bacterium]MDH3936830.1 hypothetical protein [candidate division Zixibacteria bacterium]MDH4033131.1 hypothetical protein [candidate division Zixibacteria bacterium]